LFAAVVTAQRVQQQTVAQCSRELDAFYDKHPEIQRPSSETTRNDAGVIWTQFLPTKAAFSRLRNDDVVAPFIRNIASSSDKLVALVFYQIIVGNFSIESLVQQKTVEPLLTAFTNKSLPLTFARTSRGEYTVTDGARRTITINDTKEVACNTRLMATSGFLLPSRTGSQAPRVTASLSEIQDYLDDGIFGMLPAPAPAPTALLRGAAQPAPLRTP
jgi:hypothetical protein